MDESFEPVPGARRRPFPIGLSPMLLQIRKEPFSEDGWIFEPKLDGMRCLVYVEDGNARLYSKSNREITSTFPDLADELRAQPTGVYDGELVAHDEKGFVSFERLQERWNLRKASEIAQADRQNAVSFYCFDILHLGRLSLTYVALSFRKALLSEHFKPGGRTKLVEHFIDGLTLYEACKIQKFEGIVAKLANSTYKCGLRTADWQKIKFSITDIFDIIGYRTEDGYILTQNGRVAGTVLYGFSKEDHQRVKDQLLILREEIHKKKTTVFYESSLKAEVEFMEWTSKKQLRFPVFKRFIET